MNPQQQRLKKLHYLILETWRTKDWAVCLQYMNEYQQLSNSQQTKPDRVDSDNSRRETLTGSTVRLGGTKPADTSKSNYVLWRFARTYKDNIERFWRVRE